MLTISQYPYATIDSQLPCLHVFLPAATTSFIKNVPQKSKGRKKKKKKSNVPSSIALDITETAMYEAMDTEHPVDYTYPEPSPTNYQNTDASFYTYIPTTTAIGHHDNGGRSISSRGEGEEDMYHVVGPNQMPPQSRLPPPVPHRNNGQANSVQHNKNFYHYLEDPTSNNNNMSLLYEDPNLPAYQVSVNALCFRASGILGRFVLLQERDTLFDSIGSYVPTEVSTTTGSVFC